MIEMGLCFQNISGNGPGLIRKPDWRDVVWVCGRVSKPEEESEKELELNKSSEWHLQGIYYGEESEKYALACCLDENYFVGPVTINVALPHRTVEWVGCYFPLQTPPETNKG